LPIESSLFREERVDQFLQFFIHRLSHVGIILNYILNKIICLQLEALERYEWKMNIHTHPIDFFGGWIHDNNIPLQNQILIDPHRGLLLKILVSNGNRRTKRII